MKKRNNIVLIGMPGSGKSTIGVILAKHLSKQFVDTDIVIQNSHHRKLQDLIDAYGYLKLREIEEGEVLSLQINGGVIATGGSVVYSEKAVNFLQQNGIIVYLNVRYEELVGRIKDLETRGIAKPAHQSFEDVYHEREPLYRKYADIVIDCLDLDHEEVVNRIIEYLE